jgi:hypothetical protein
MTEEPPQLIYEHPQPVERRDAYAVFASDDPSRIVETLLGIAYYDPDWRWAQAQFIHFATHPVPNVRRIAGMCLSYLTMFRGVIDMEAVVPVLDALRHDPDPDARVDTEQAIGDIGRRVPRRLLKQYGWVYNRATHEWQLPDDYAAPAEEA